MKKSILMLAIASCIGLSRLSAQTVNQVKLSDLKEEYLLIGEDVRLGRTFISIDYGQKRTTSSEKEMMVKDSMGNNFEFNSTIDFFNRMKKNGYELFQVYTPAWRGDTTVKYILKRKSN